MKKILIIGTIALLAAAAIGFALFHIFRNENHEENDTVNNEQIVVQPNQKTGINQNEISSLLEIEFNDKKDGDRFECSGHLNLAALPKAFIDNGVYSLEHYLKMNYYVSSDNTVIHIRMNISEYDTEDTITQIQLLSPFDKNHKELTLEIVKGSPYCLFAENSELMSPFYTFDSGETTVTSGWKDILFYRDENNISIVIADEENSQDIACITLQTPDEWSNYAFELAFQREIRLHEDAELMPSEIDFIKVYSADIEDYLKEYIPSYSDNKKIVNEKLEVVHDVIDEAEFIERAPLNEMNNNSNEPEDEGGYSPFRTEEVVYIDGPEKNFGLQPDAATEDILDIYFNGIVVKQEGDFLDFNASNLEVETVEENDDSYYILRNGEEWTVIQLEPRLKTACGGNRNQQAIYMEFMFDEIRQNNFEFNDRENITIGIDGGIWLEYRTIGKNLHFIPHNPYEGFRMDSNKVYCMAAGFDYNAVFRCIVWEKDNFYNRTYHEYDLGGSTSSAINNDWEVMIELNGNNEFTLYENTVFTFDDYTEVDEEENWVEIKGRERTNYGLDADAEYGEILNTYYMDVEIELSELSALEMNYINTAGRQGERYGRDCYVFSSGSEDGSIEFSPTIKEICGSSTRWGYYTEFELSKIDESSISFAANEAVNMNMYNGWTHMRIIDYIPYSTQTDYDIKPPKENTVYCMAIGFNKHGYFRAVIWEKDNYYYRIYFEGDIELLRDQNNSFGTFSLVYNLSADTVMYVYESVFFTFDEFTDSRQ